MKPLQMRRGRLNVRRGPVWSAIASRFSLQAFHNVVLGLRTAPLQILESEVPAYIRTERAR